MELLLQAREPLTFSEFLRLLPRGWLAGFGVLLGLVFGSFYNVVIYRLPRRIDLAKPRSFCPHCEEMIPWYRNVPVVSFLLLRGRCGACKGPISIRYPLVEAAAGVLFAASLYRWGISWSALSSIFFGSAMLLLAVIDYDVKILPNAITLPGIALGLGLSLPSPRIEGWESLLGAALGGSLLYTVAWVYRALRQQEGMGMGDVKMITMVGAFVGWKGALLTIFLGSLLGSLVGVGLMKVKGKQWDYALPFGTFLAIAAVVVDWGGREMMAWYWGVTGFG